MSDKIKPIRLRIFLCLIQSDSRTGITLCRVYKGTVTRHFIFFTFSLYYYCVDAVYSL